MPHLAIIENNIVLSRTQPYFCESLYGINFLAEDMESMARIFFSVAL